MATADQVKALIKSHAAGDDERFYAVALQLAAREAQSGHAAYARDLKELVDTAKRRTLAASPTPVAVPRGDLASLLAVEYPDERLADLVLDKAIMADLKRVLLEQRQRDQLRATGFAPLRRLLLLGPPGTGKTMTARVIAGELHLPLFSVRLDGLITKFMGETASKLRIVFDAVAQTPGVYLFDEVDALAGSRTQGNDVGEIRRVLNSFLQFMEQDHSDSVIAATSNLPEFLDRALFRRFDITLNYPMPSGAVANQVIRNRLTSLNLEKIDWRRLVTVSKGLSHAEVTSAAERAAKEAILSDVAELTTEHLITALKMRATVIEPPSA
ncbi:MAG: ATP-binding protein [Acidimicrobiaceae bacterium]|nr:ATP-binding protein [Acidimicrobiaceae bacterium]